MASRRSGVSLCTPGQGGYLVESPAYLPVLLMTSPEVAGIGLELGVVPLLLIALPCSEEDEVLSAKWDFIVGLFLLR